MDIEVIEKGQSFNIDVASKAKGKYYFGAGWDNPNGPVDLDIVCCLLTAGKLAKQEDLIYFGNRFAPGVELSKDNTTGDGDGDDESIIFDTGEIESSIDSIVVGLAAYAGADLSNATNPHFRVCDGDNEGSPQIADIAVTEGAKSGDTVLSAFKLIRGADGWTLTNLGEFCAKGAGKESIQGFAALYQ